MSVVADIETVIVQATDETRPEAERARLAIDACRRIREHNVKLIRAFDWIELRRQWEAMHGKKKGKR